MWYGCKEIMMILGCKREHAYRIIRMLRAELESKGYLPTPQGKIQKSYFCERLHLDKKECEKFLKEQKSKKGA